MSQNGHVGSVGTTKGAHTQVLEATRSECCVRKEPCGGDGLEANHLFKHFVRTPFVVVNNVSNTEGGGGGGGGGGRKRLHKNQCRSHNRVITYESHSQDKIACTLYECGSEWSQRAFIDFERNGIYS